MRSTAAALAVLALAACNRAGEKAPVDPPAPVVEAKEVAAADAYGAAGEKVTAVAFWSHPSINFESLVIASTATGLKSYKIETGDAVAAAPDTGPTGAVSVFYAGPTPAQGYAIAAAGAGYVVRAIDNATGAFSTIDVEMGAPGAGKFCVGRLGEGHALYEIEGRALMRRRLDVLESRVAIGDPEPFAASAQAASCHIDDRNGAVVTVGADGAIKRLDAATGESFGLAMIEGLAPDASALLLSTDVADESRQSGVIALLDGHTGVIRLADLADGHALGAVRVKSTFDLDAVGSATSIALGSGNYGGVYRDGALAVVTAAEGQAPIRLVPWNGVLSAVQLPLGENVDPRDPSPVAEDAPIIDIEFVKP